MVCRDNPEKRAPGADVGIPASALDMADAAFTAHPVVDSAAALARVVAALRLHLRIRSSFRERPIHDDIASALTKDGIHHLRESRCRAPATGRMDFLCEGGVAIEVKVGKAGMDAWRQVRRYLLDPRVGSALLVTSRLGEARPSSLEGKPVAAFETWQLLL